MPMMHVMIPHTPNFRSAQKELSENAFCSSFGKEAVQQCICGSFSFMKMSRTIFPREPNSLDVKLYANSYARLFSLFSKTVELATHTRGLLITVPRYKLLWKMDFDCSQQRQTTDASIHYKRAAKKH
ncbi:hypothetical protein LguiA_012974 [Lonicera macranthoides]